MKGTHVLITCSLLRVGAAIGVHNTRNDAYFEPFVFEPKAS